MFEFLVLMNTLVVVLLIYGFLYGTFGEGKNADNICEKYVLEWPFAFIFIQLFLIVVTFIYWGIQSILLLFV